MTQTTRHVNFSDGRCAKALCQAKLHKHDYTSNAFMQAERSPIRFGCRVACEPWVS